MDSAANSEGSGSIGEPLRLHPLNDKEREFIINNFPNGEPVKRIELSDFWRPVAAAALRKLQIRAKGKVVNGKFIAELINASP